MIYQNWLTKWQNYYVKPIVRPQTYEKYKQQISNHIVPLLGEYDMDELTAEVLQSFTITLNEKGLAINTVNSIVTLLKSSLHRARIIGYLEKDYSDLIVRPKGREKRIDSFTLDEQKKIEQYIASQNKQKYFGIIICLYTGIRLGELLALTWDDIDLTKGLLSISKSCHDSWKNGEYIKVIDSPKTENSVRIIPLPKQLLAKLRTLKRTSSSIYIIQGKSKYGGQVRSYQRTFELILNKLKIPHKGFHSLRHSFATRALECGMDIKTLSEILGHKNPNITLKRYAHSMIEHKIEMMNRIGRLLQN